MSNGGTVEGAGPASGSGPNSPTGVEPVLQLHPTRHCNLACAHCYTSSGPTVREELGLGMVQQCLADAAELGYRQLAVSGGEPLLYKPLLDLLRSARSSGMLNTLTSNGLLLTAARMHELAPWLDLVAISIDGSPRQHDLMRGQAGAFSRTVANFKHVRASGVPFALIFTLTQFNVDELEFIVRLAASEGARGVQIHPLTLYGRASQTLHEARPDAIELMAAIVEAERIGANLGVRVHVDALSLAQLQNYRAHLVPEFPVQHLIDVAPVLIVRADGLVLPFTHEVSPQLHLGSLHGASLLELAAAWLNSRACQDLVAACAHTWDDVLATKTYSAYWYDEVATRTYPDPVSVGA